MFSSLWSLSISPYGIGNNISFENVVNSLITPLPLNFGPQLFSPDKIKHCIKFFLLKKSPRLDLVTAKVVHQLTKEALIHLTHILNSLLKLLYFFLQWKVSVIILFPKSGEPPEIPSSYCPISLLPFFTKLYEKIIIKRISKIISYKQIIPHTQFGFHNKHSTIYQIHRLTDFIAYFFENKLYYIALLLCSSSRYCSSL